MISLRLRRARWRRRQALPRVLAQAWSVPLPPYRASVKSLRFLVCDAEMSGLDPGAAELLSLGWVRVERQEICLDSARHLLVKSERSVGQSATIHRLRDCELLAGEDLEQALSELLLAARDHVLVFHNAPLDMAFLNRAAKRLWGVPLLLPSVDTLRMEERLLRREREVLVEGALRLSTCRERYALGAHRAHSALGDALATAELFLAQLAKRGGDLRLRDLR